MNDRIRHLLKQMASVEEELNQALEDQVLPPSFQLKNKRIKFDRSVRAEQARHKVGFFRWLVSNRPQNLITAPIIYSMIVPLLILDLFVSLYQATCFPIYRISRVDRSDYLVFDRQHLAYLNFMEKVHCSYCAYGRGLIAYVGEIIARTESYFCPIKHARRVLGIHARYMNFLKYGEAADYATNLEKIRNALMTAEECRK